MQKTDPTIQLPEAEAFSQNRMDSFEKQLSEAVRKHILKYYTSPTQFWSDAAEECHTDVFHSFTEYMVNNKTS